MRYLWLTRWPPFRPLNAGDIVYSRNFLESLANVAQVDVLAFEAAGVSPPSRPNVSWRQIPYRQASKAASLVSRLPNVANRHDVPAYLEAMQDLARSADVVVVDHIGLAHCVGLLRRRVAGGASRPAVILINHNYETALRQALAASARNPVSRLAFTWDGWKAAALERAANRGADGLTAITSTDLDAFRRLAPGVPALLATPGYEGPVTHARTISADTPERVCIVGGRGPFHKQLVLTRMLDALVAAGLQNRIAIDVVGGGLDGKLEGRRARYPGVNFLGFVDDLQAYFQTVRLGLIPDEFGGGFKVRALSHIFMRTPMLALPSALAGMGLRRDVDFASAPSIAGIAEAIPALLGDLARLNAIQEAAFSSASGKYDWASRGVALDRFAQGLVSGVRGARLAAE